MRTSALRLASAGLSVVLLTLASCSDDRTVEAEDLDGSAFTSTSVEGQTLVEGTQIRLAFDDGLIAADGGCNTMTGGYFLDGHELLVQDVSQTLQGCPNDLIAQDQWLLVLLEAEPTIDLRDDELTLKSDDTTLVLARDA